MQSNLFRQKALDKLSSPERLDQLLSVTPRRAWLALLAIVGIIVAALVWSVFGSLPTRVSGPGIFVRVGGAFQIVSRGDGSVIGLDVGVGDLVKKGETIGHLELPELQVRVENAEARLAELEKADRISDEADAANLRLTVAALDERRSTLEQSAADFDEQTKALAEQVGIQRDLQKRGLIPRSTLLSNQTALASSQQSASNARVELANTETSRSEILNNLREKDEARRLGIADAGRELRTLQKQYDEAINIRSPFDGQIIEIQADIGNVVRRGESVLSLENTHEVLQCLLFIPAGEGKKVKAGMAAQLAPSVAKREEYGFLKGTVESVSGLPATDAAADAILHNTRLVEQLFARGNPIIVTVELIADTATPSGFAWSTSQGPPTDITSGTLAEGQIVVQRQRPITLVLPYLRQLFGVH